LTAIRGILFGQDAGEIKGFNHQSLAGLHYYESKVPPRTASAPSRWKTVQGPEERMQLMKFQDFEPMDQVLLSEELPSGISSRLSGVKADLQCERLTDDPDRQTFKVRLDRDSLVVFSEVMFPGWKAFLDGNPAEIFTGNHAFRTVFVPAGDHKVEFVFEPAWAKPLLIGTILWLVSVLAFCAFTFGRKDGPGPSGDKTRAAPVPPHA